MTEDEKKVVEFLVQDVRKHQKTHNDELNTPAFDEAYMTGKDKGEPEYKVAIELARSYCSFYSNPEVREVRRLAQRYVDLCQIKPQIAQMLSETVEPEFVLNIRRSLQGLVYSQVIERGKERTKELLYTDNEGSQLQNYTPGMWQIVYNEDVFNNIDTYYKLFNDQYLWVRLTKGALENNARSLIGPLTAHISLFELAIRIDAQYPFAQVVNDERAIVVGLECDFENDDIKLILAEPGGKLSYISSHNLNDVSMVGADRITKEPIDSETVAKDFGLIVENFPEINGVDDDTPSETPAYDVPKTSKGQFRGFNRPEPPKVESNVVASEENEEKAPHETMETLKAPSLSFTAEDFAADYGENYKNSVNSGSYSFDDDNVFPEPSEEDDEEEDFDDVDNTFDNETWN